MIKIKKTSLLLLAVLYAIVFPLNNAAQQMPNGEYHSPANKADTITYQEMVGRLIDLKSLAILPVVGEKSAMWSSYDRKSEYDNLAGSYKNWAANNDGLTPQYIRKENGYEVLAEMKGPGAIVRIWSASPKKGHVKIYIDGQETPVIDLPFKNYFNDSLQVFSYNALVYADAASGKNNYVPIPYQYSCKIVAEPGWGQYYHFNYITFPTGTRVEPFSLSLAERSEEALQKVNDFLKTKKGESPYSDTSAVLKKTGQITIPAGNNVTLAEIEGPAAIKAIKIKPLLRNSDDTARAMRLLTLQIKWDEGKQLGVWSPLGDFFGSSPGINYYKTLPMGMDKEGLYSYWYMPFRKSVQITIGNDDTLAYQLQYVVEYERLGPEIRNMAYFHAKWHRDIPSGLDKSRWPDWPVLSTNGRGRFVGMMLNVWNPKGGHCREFGGPGYWWWGEGDEKFFVDGESFPSTYGTGTEDYFGYAWCNPAYFQKAFHSQSIDMGNMGYQTMTRWQIMDNVPFQHSFEGYIEKYFPNHWPTQYAVTVYWYLDKDGKDKLGTVSPQQRYGFEIPYDIYRVHNALEAENLEIIENTGAGISKIFVGEKNLQKFSGHKILVWREKTNVANDLTFRVSTKAAGEYRLILGLVQSGKSRKLKVYLNEKLLANNIDMSGTSAGNQPFSVDLGKVRLKENENRLKVEMSGNETDSIANIYNFDYFLFEPLK